jgi:alpha-D-xyloside xylohydrolase
MHENLRYHLGNGLEVGSIYPLLHQQGIFEGLKSVGETDIIALSRSAWAGSQRYGMAVWSGDIRSTFASLNTQVRAGLNNAMSGIPWWTTDIGGFFGGEPANPEFRELLVRWFQYGAFCPLFRLHGYRLPAVEQGGFGTGADNEVWSYGEEVYTILRQFMFIREKLRPYLAAQGKIAEEKGLPPMRPVFFDFVDPSAQSIDDQFLLGADLLAAPILEKGAQSRMVYLPQGADWVDAWTGITLAGGQSIQAPAPLARMPVYWKKGSPWFFLFEEIGKE